MSDQTPFFLMIGAGASVLFAIGLAAMKSRGETLPAAQGRARFAAIGQWVSDPVWLGGLGLQTGGYVLYLVALSGAPISMLAVTMQGGIALFVVVAALFLNECASPLEWIGIASIVAAILLLGLSLPGGSPVSATNQPLLTLLSVVGATAALLAYWAAPQQPAGVASAIASGVAFGMGSLYAKAMVGMVALAPITHAAFTLLSSPWAYLAVAANLIGLVLLQNSFHAARGIIVIPLSSAWASLVPIVGGIVAFGERLPTAGAAAALRIAAFGLTILASGFLATTRD